MTITLPAIRKGDSLVLLQPLDDVPEGSRIDVTVRTGSDAASGGWNGEEIRAFEAAAYGSDEPDYGTLDSLE